LIVSGAMAWSRQLQAGLGVTAMRDQVSWGFYIGNFTFLVGVAAAAVVLGVPGDIFKWKPIREIVVYGGLLAISAIAMCLMFVIVDIGRPDRYWHLQHHDIPRQDAAWKVQVADLYRAFHGKAYLRRLVVPLLQLLRRFTRFEIQDAAIWKIA